MKLIQAYVRTTKAEEVVRALEKAHAPGITISRVFGVGYGYDPYLFTLSPRELDKVPAISKVEVVCHDTDVDRLLSVLVGAARTGYKGDGIVFVLPVERAVKVRTGLGGSDALAPRENEPDAT